jgi:protein SCO1
MIPRLLLESQTPGDKPPKRGRGMRRACGAILATVLLMACQRSELPVMGELAPFTLERSTGDAVTPESMGGSVWVAHLFFTSCPSVCPMMMRRLSSLQETFRGRPDVKFLSATVDPENDTAAVLNRYASKYGADPGRWWFVRGKPAELDLLATKSFKLGTPDEPALHSPRMVLIDREGRIRGFYSADHDQSIESLISDIRALLD